MEDIRIQDNLYMHVNQETLDRLVIPDDRPSTGGFAELADGVEKIMMGEFEDMAASGSYPNEYLERACKLYAIAKDAETKEKLSPSDYRLAHTAYADGVPVAIVNDHPRHSNGDILDAYLWLIGEAKREIKIVTPYFLPPPSIRRALTHAVERGVDVQILISAKGDIALTPEGSKRMGYKLTKRGVNVFLFNGGFHHSKVMSIDDDCCMIGSANLESRSLFYDHEQNAIVVDTALVDDFVEIYEADKLNSDTLTRELYKSATPWKIPTVTESLTVISL